MMTLIFNISHIAINSVIYFFKIKNTIVLHSVNFNMLFIAFIADNSVRIMQSKLCRYSDERTLIVRSHMGERAVYYIGACMSRARPNQALAHATE